MLDFTKLMSSAKSQEWVHQNSTNQPTNQPTMLISRHVRHFKREAYFSLINEVKYDNYFHNI